MASASAFKRLTREYNTLQNSPVEYIVAKPSEKNILEWHYVISGPPDTPYHNGQYHGTLVFPTDYPFKPPAIRMVTPSGRFQPNMKICLSMSDYHPRSWNPSWMVSTILTGLLSFMTSEECSTGAIKCGAEKRKQFARISRKWNNTRNPSFKIEFPELYLENETILNEENLNADTQDGEPIKVSLTEDSDVKERSARTHTIAAILIAFVAMAFIVWQ